MDLDVATQPDADHQQDYRIVYAPSWGGPTWVRLFMNRPIDGWADVEALEAWLQAQDSSGGSPTLIAWQPMGVFS